MEYVAKSVEDALLCSEYIKAKEEIMQMECKKLRNLAIKELNATETYLGLPLTSITPLD